MAAEIETALIRYVQALEKGAAGTHAANDRPLFTARLAAAAGIFADLQLGEFAAVKRRVAEEQLALGRSYLSGDGGGIAEKAFNEFAKLVAAR